MSTIRKQPRRQPADLPPSAYQHWCECSKQNCGTPPGEAESFATVSSAERTNSHPELSAPRKSHLVSFPGGFFSLLSSTLPSFGCLRRVSCPLPSPFVNTVLRRRAHGFTPATFVGPRRRPFLAMVTVQRCWWTRMPLPESRSKCLSRRLDSLFLSFCIHFNWHYTFFDVFGQWSGLGTFVSSSFFDS